MAAAAVPLVMEPWWSSAFAAPKTVAMVVASAVLALTVTIARPRARWRRGRTPLALLGTVAGFAILSTLVTADPGHSLLGEHGQHQGLVTLLCYGAAFVAAWRSVGPYPSRRLLAWILVAGGAVVATYGLVQLVGADPIWLGVLDKGRIFSTVGQANALAAVFVLTIPLTGGLATIAAGRARLLALAVLVMEVVAFAYAQSRGGYLGLAVGLCGAGLLWLLRSRRWRNAPTEASRGRSTARRSPSVRTLALGAFAMLAVAALVGPIVVSRIATHETRMMSSTPMRFDLWATGAAMAIDNPVVGIGPDAFALRFPEYRDRMLTRRRARAFSRYRPQNPHSVPIGIGAAIGIPALAAAAVLVLWSLRSAARRILRAEPAEAVLLAASVAAIVGWLVAGLFMGAEASSMWLAAVVLGSLAAPAVARRPYPIGPPDARWKAR